MNMSGLVPLAPRIFELFDYNHDGWVDLRELICGFSLLRTSQAEEALRLCFQVCVKATEGSLSFHWLTSLSLLAQITCKVDNANTVSLSIESSYSYQIGIFLNGS